MTRAPYKYLDSYAFEDADLYFGREEEIIRTVGGILSARLLVLFAASGSGKTSLINAGVRPELERRQYRTLYCRPHGDPVGEIRRRLAPVLDAGASIVDPSLPDLMRLYTQAGPAGEQRPLVVFLDQFEEFFISLRDRPQARAHFATQLAAAVFDNTLPVYFVLSLRDDYFVRLNEFREAIPSIFQNNANVQLRPLRRPDALRAIVEPAAAVGLVYEEGLTERIVTDLERLNSEGSGVLPITLQMVCHRLWQRASSDGRPVTEQLYEEQLGGASRVIDGQIDDALGRVPQRWRRTLPHLFRRLITEDETRQLRSFAELTTGSRPRAAMRLQQVLDRLTEVQLLRAERLGESVYYEFGHDYLVPRIEAWLRRYERDALRRRSRYGLVPAVLLALAVLAVALVQFANVQVQLDPGSLANQHEELYVTRAYDPFGLKIGTGFGSDTLRDHDAVLKARDGFRISFGRTVDWQGLADLLADGPASRLLLASGHVQEGLSRCLEQLKYSGKGDADPAFTLLRHWSATRPEVVEGLLAALRSDDSALRAAAATTLGHLGKVDPPILDELAAALAEHAPAAGAAAGALSQLARTERAAVARLLAVLKTGGEAAHPAALALVDSGVVDREVIEALAGAVGGANRSTALAAAAGLAERGIDRPGVAEVLLSVLRGAEYDSLCVPACAASYLGKLGQADPEVIAGLADALQSPIVGTSSAAAEALGRLGHADQQVIRALLTALKSDDVGAQTAAAETLGRLGDASPQVIDALVSALGTHRASDAAARALGNLGRSQPNAIAALVATLDARDPETVLAAAAALAELRKTAPETVARLEEALSAEMKGAVPLASQGAAIKLAWLGRADADVIDRLLEAMTAEYRPLSEPATRALGGLGRADPRVLRGLLDARKRGDDDPGIALALGGLGKPDPEVLAQLVADLRQPWQARAAAVALGQLGDAGPEVVAGLQAALRYTDTETVRAATLALGRLGQRRSDWTNELLVTRLADHDTAWRTTAAVVIANREPLDPELEAAVSALREDERPWARLAAWDTHFRIQERKDRQASTPAVGR